jgi:LacI family transcriptional regulator
LFRKEIAVLEMLSNGNHRWFYSSENKTSKNRQTFQTIINEGTALMFDRTTDEVSCNKVVVDDLDSSENATQHLIQLG